MNERIITASEIRMWKSCPKRWWFRYHEELVPNRTAAPLSYGRLMHCGLEAYYLGEDPIEKLGIAFSEAVHPWDDEAAEYVLSEAEALLEGYTGRDPVKERGDHILAVEEEGVVPLRTPTGRKWNHLQLGFKIDLQTEDKFGNVWAWDHKTSAMALKDNWLPLDNQMGYYFWALGQLGKLPQGIIYNLIRKPSIKPRQTESVQDWEVRLSADINSRPEFYYQRAMIVKDKRDLAGIEAELWAIAHQIGREPIYRNPGSCQILGCGYNEICQADTPAVRSVSYRHEDAHIELKEVLD